MKTYRLGNRRDAAGTAIASTKVVCALTAVIVAAAVVFGPERAELTPRAAAMSAGNGAGSAASTPQGTPIFVFDDDMVNDRSNADFYVDFFTHGDIEWRECFPNPPTSITMTETGSQFGAAEPLPVHAGFTSEVGATLFVSDKGQLQVGACYLRSQPRVHMEVFNHGTSTVTIQWEVRAPVRAWGQENIFLPILLQGPPYLALVEILCGCNLGDQFSTVQPAWTSFGWADVLANLPFRIVDSLNGDPWPTLITVAYDAELEAINYPNPEAVNDDFANTFGHAILQLWEEGPGGLVNTLDAPIFVNYPLTSLPTGDYKIVSQTESTSNAINVPGFQETGSAPIISFNLDSITNAFIQPPHWVPQEKPVANDFARALYRGSITLRLPPLSDPCCPAQPPQQCHSVHNDIGCDVASCCNLVRLADPECCIDQWDDYCCEWAQILCSQAPGASSLASLRACGRPAANDCVSASTDPGCNDVATCARICMVAPDCCYEEWTQDCANLVLTLSMVGGSCAGRCDERGGLVECSCDDLCAVFLDCCDDVCTECTQPHCPEPTMCPPRFCSLAREVGLVSQMPFHNVGAVPTDGPPVPGCGFNGSSDSDVWFRFTAGSGTLHTVLVEAGAGPNDRHLAIYEGACPQNGGTLFACDTGSVAVDLHFIPTAGQVYYIRVGTPGGAAGQSASMLTITAVTPQNELCSAADPIGLVTLFPFDNFGAVTDGPAEPGCGFTGTDDSDKWFEFTAHQTAGYHVTLNPTSWPSWNRRLAVYESTCPHDGGPLVVCDFTDDGTAAEVSFNADAGEVYYIRVGTAFGAAGQGTSRLTIVAITPPCPGDITGNGQVDVFDLLALLACWGPITPGSGCEPVDLTGNGVVDVFDLLALLAQWGPCP